MGGGETEVRYILATEDSTIRSKLEAGDLLLVFPAKEQWLAELAMRAVHDAIKGDYALMELILMIRCLHDKSEEN